MKFTFVYKNGNVITQDVLSAMIEDDEIRFTTKKQVHGIVREVVRVPLKNIDSVFIDGE